MTTIFVAWGHRRLIIERHAPLVIGHRGASAHAPENTLAAFELALADGADGLEFDVRLARDGVPVVIHDSTLRRTTGRADKVAALSSSALAEIDVGSWFNRRFPAHARDEYASQHVPTLAAVVRQFAPRCHVLYVELKCDRTNIHALAAATVGVLRANADAARGCVVESFTLDALVEIKRLAPELRTAALFERTLRQPRVSARALVARALDCGADEIALQRSLVSRRTIDAAHAAGLPTVVWTVDHPSWARRAKAFGLRALITNYPARLRDALDACAGGNPPRG
jgi:glycerophosphoryl diester phosphodiesterase